MTGRGIGFTCFYRRGGAGRGSGYVAPDGAKVIFGVWIYKYFAPLALNQGERFGLIWRGQWQAHGDKEVFRFWFDLVLPGSNRGVAAEPRPGIASPRVRDKWWLRFGTLWGGWFMIGRGIGFTCFYRA